MLRSPLLPLTALALLLFALVPAVSAQENGLQVSIESVDGAAFPDVTATVSVLDDSGRPVAGIPAEAFQASFDGSPAATGAVASVTDAGLPIATTLTFDVSGSMQGPPLEQARQGGLEFVRRLGPGDSAAVIAFGTEVILTQPFTEDVAALEAAIGGLEQAGATALYEAVAQSAEAAAAADAPRRAVVLLSDGFEFGGISTVEREESLQIAADAGVPFFVVGLGDEIDVEYLQELAAVTRGRFFEAPSPETLAALYENISDLLRSQYALSIEALDPAAAETATLRIEVAHNDATGAAETSVALPVQPPVEPPVATPPVVPEPEPEPVAEETTSAWPVAAGVALGFLLLGGTLFVMRLRRRIAAAEEEEEPEIRILQPAPAGEPTPVRLERPQPQADAGPVRATLRLLSAAAGRPREYPLRDAPVTLGFSPDCEIRLPGNGGGEVARVWRRDGRYMLHGLSRLHAVRAGGRAITWAVLEDGDEIEIGAVRILFKTKEPS